MKKAPLFITAVTGLLLSLSAFSEEVYSVYLVRHAEKQKVDAKEKDPALTNCGRFRASQIADILSDVKLSAIYSTKYQRTMTTAQPTSQQKHIPIKNYSGGDLDQLALSLKQLKQNALVVGHSNTTPQLVELLTGEKASPIAESEYQKLYQIQFFQDQINITLLTQPLVCR